MKKKLMLVMVSIFVLSLVVSGLAAAHTLDVVGDGNDTISTGRTIEDYKAELKALTGADEVGDLIIPERNNVKYLFVPLYKDGEVIGYGSWVNAIIYNHPEDMIAVIGKDGISKWKPIDANDHHPELKDEEYLSRYYGMTLDTPFNPEVDVISGSTYSSYTFFFELKNILLTFENYIAPNL